MKQSGTSNYCLISPHPHPYTKLPGTFTDRIKYFLDEQIHFCMPYESQYACLSKLVDVKFCLYPVAEHTRSEHMDALCLVTEACRHKMFTPFGCTKSDLPTQLLIPKTTNCDPSKLLQLKGHKMRWPTLCCGPQIWPSYNTLCRNAVQNRHTTYDAVILMIIGMHVNWWSSFCVYELTVILLSLIMVAFFL